MEKNKSVEGKRVLKLASPGKRFGAFIIDQVPMTIVAIVFAVTCVAAVAVSESTTYSGGECNAYFGPEHPAWIGVIVVCAILTIAYIVVQCIFFARSQTIGKAILGMRVVHSKNGEPIGFWWMFFREVIVKTASEAVFCLGYIWILIDDQHRGWHDKILDTYVIDEKE